VPYCLRVTEEEKIYEKLLAASELRDAPRAPGTLEMLARFSVLTRLKEHANSSLFSKMRVYDGESLKETDPSSKTVQEYRDMAGVDEGMEGVSTRFAYKILSEVFNFDTNEVAADPVHLMYVLEQAIRREQLPGETEGQYIEFVKEELAQRYADGGLPPWRVEVDGLVEEPFTLDLDDLFAFPLEERLYRFRCVERWAMQVPWTGFPLAALIDRCRPLGKATHVRFVSFLDEERLPGQTEYGHYPWPYFEGLRLDEARHPLAFVVLGVYGHPLPMQHGAPWRLAIPWKYGYKGPKAVVRIELTEGRPETFWHQAQPREYGFFSNVDPGRPHPRWTQQTETDIGTGVMRPTLLYNGYASVAEMYEGWEH